MSLTDTANLLEESRRIIDVSSNDPNCSIVVLNMILKLVTSIDSRMKNMDTNIDKRLDELKQSILGVSGRVRTLESQVSEFHSKIGECEASCQGVSNLFDKVDHQVKCNTRNVIHQDIRIKKLEEKPIVQPVVQPVIQSEEIETLKETVLDLKCRSMKNNLIFTGLHRVQNEITENLLDCFLYNELGIEHKIEFGNVHRIKTRGDHRRAPIVARFIYHRDLQHVLANAGRLKGKPYSIREQFPPEIEARRRKLYPVMKEAKSERKHCIMVRDKLFIDNVPYVPENDIELESDQITNNVNDHTSPKGPYLGRYIPRKRPRQGSSPRSTQVTSQSPAHR